MTSLIDRYVYTVLRRVPERQRTDIDRELRTSIEDAVEARVENGEPRDAAIEQTLVELGDPDRLADGYADRALYLIGPELYPAWRRLLMMLLSIVLPAVVAVTTVIQLLDDPAIGPVIGGAVSTAITVGTHMAFWVTLIFAILERSGVGRTELRGLPGRPWTPDDLPRYELGFLTPSQLVAGLLWPVLLITALILQQFTFTDVPVLDPDNWTSWWPYFMVVLALEGVYAVWLYRSGAWTHAATVANAVLAVLFTVPLVWLLAEERFFNPEWIATLDRGSDTDPLSWLTGMVIGIAVIGAIYDVIDVGIRAERARRGLATQVLGTAPVA